MYLDNAATTKIHSLVWETMSNVSFANYNAMYYEQANLTKTQIDNATKLIANKLNIDVDSIVYTSGATESNNYIIKAMYELFPDKHFITSTIEHKCVLESFAYIESKGANVTYIKPNKNCQITLEAVSNAITDNTIFASIMHVNNETGVINDIGAISHLLKDKGIYFHSDCAQSIGKLVFDWSIIDFITISGHKIYGPKGIGILVNNTDLKLPSLIHGSDQQAGNRAGTLANELIVGMGKAIELVCDNVDNGVLKRNKQYITNVFKENFGSDVHINFKQVETVDSILSIRIDGEINQIFLNENSDSIAASSGSSCSIEEPSYVLKECSFSDKEITYTIRLSFSMFDNLQDD